MCCVCGGGCKRSHPGTSTRARTGCLGALQTVPCHFCALPGMVSQHRGLAQPVFQNFRRMHHAVCDVLMRVVGDLRGQFMTSTGRMGLGLGFRFPTSETTRSGITGVILAATLLW